MCKTSRCKNDRLVCWIRIRDFEPKVLIKGANLTNFKKNCWIESWVFYMKKGIHIMNPKKAKNVYVTVLLFILYSI